MSKSSQTHRVVTLASAPQSTPVQLLHILRDSFQPKAGAQSSACNKFPRPFGLLKFYSVLSATLVVES